MRAEDACEMAICRLLVDELGAIADTHPEPTLAQPVDLRIRSLQARNDIIADAIGDGS